MRLADSDRTWGDDRQPAPESPWRGATHGTAKAVADYALAVILGVLALPATLLAAVLVKLTSRGPAFYTQTRVGLNGVPYRIWKLRTMHHECEKHSGAVWSAGRADPRITTVGRILRRTHIDELPQLWNVLRGEMSLVGPRPERPEFVTKLERVIPRYRERLRIRPGVTGLAQVQLPPDADEESVRRKLVYDLYYSENANFWLDLRLILSTALKVFCVPFYVSRVLLNIPGGGAVEGRDSVDDETPDTDRGLAVVRVGGDVM